MEKIIIENQTDMSMFDVLPYVNHVIMGGRISGTKKDQYCFFTVWESGVCISTTKNKKSDKFVVWMDKNK